MTISIQEAVRDGMVIQHDAPRDEEHWYHIQHMGAWYYVLACCRTCATRGLHAWTNAFGEVKTHTSPPWLVKADDG